VQKLRASHKATRPIGRVEMQHHPSSRPTMLPRFKVRALTQNFKKFAQMQQHPRSQQSRPVRLDSGPRNRGVAKRTKRYFSSVHFKPTESNIC